MDPFGPARPERNPFDEPDHPSLRIAPTSAQLPHDFDPLAPEPRETPFRGPTQADNSPVTQDAFHLPAQVGQMPLHSGGVIPGDDLLPDDWDKDLLEGIAPAPAAATAACRAPPPRARCPPQRVEAQATGRPPHEPPSPPHRPGAAPPREPEAVADDGALLAAFLEGAGMQDAHPDGSAGDHARVGQGVPQPGRRTARRADRARRRSRANSASSRR